MPAYNPKKQHQLEDTLLEHDPEFCRLFTLWANAKEEGDRENLRLAVFDYRDRRLEAYKSTNPGLYKAICSERARCLLG